MSLAEKYLVAYERITGTPLALNVGDVHARIEHRYAIGERAARYALMSTSTQASR